MQTFAETMNVQRSRNKRGGISGVRRRRRQPHQTKSDEQIEELEREFAANPDLDRARLQVLATRIRLSNRQVYKWMYDRRAGHLKGGRV